MGSSRATSETEPFRVSGERAPAPADGGFFSSEPFLGAIAEALYPGKRWRRELVAVGGLRYRVLVVGRDEVVGQLRNMPFSYRPLGPSEPGERRIDYLPGVLRRQVSKAEWLASERRGRPSSFIDLRRFPRFEDYLAESDDWHGPAKWFGKRRQTALRALARAHGETQFAFEPPEPALLRQLLAWKAANLDEDGTWHAMGQRATARVYAALAERGVLECLTLRVGGRLAAGIVGTSWEGRFLCRLLVHDRSLGHFSPGTHLLHELIRGSHARGLAEVDFLLGAEEYKWHYVTDVRVIGGTGRAPLRTRAMWRLTHWRPLRRALRAGGRRLGR